MKTEMTKGVGFDQFYESGGGKSFAIEISAIVTD